MPGIQQNQLAIWGTQIHAKIHNRQGWGGGQSGSRGEKYLIVIGGKRINRMLLVPKQCAFRSTVSCGCNIREILYK